VFRKQMCLLAKSSYQKGSLLWFMTIL